ncbi:hypothetical protein UFOVP37_10 [uncultured Caudovirales phage]|uniref:Uncharacterized protein n=1 Tax=uncultured Caudovirales phage TaxID=2100421 RepID=A0A6J5KLT8_9CAUD|nr:hypothetical protein UFOVP37_10 [uncultured Caudovirales phage]
MEMKHPKALALADSLEYSLESIDGSSLPRRCQDIADEAASELRRLHQQELALAQWFEKTEWIPIRAQPIELGHHRADVIQMRIARLYALNSDLLDALKMAVSALERSDYIQMDGDSFDVVDEAREAIARAEAA